eukprot:37036_1
MASKIVSNTAYSGVDFNAVCTMKHGGYFERYWSHMKHTLPQNKICLEYLKTVHPTKKLVYIQIAKTATSALRATAFEPMTALDRQRNEEYLENNRKYLNALNLEERYWNPRTWAYENIMGPTHIPLLNFCTQSIFAISEFMELHSQIRWNWMRCN